MLVEITRSAAVIAEEINSIKSQTSGILTAALAYTKRSCFEIGKRLVDPRGITIGKHHVKDRRVRHPQICCFG